MQHVRRNEEAGSAHELGCGRRQSVLGDHDGMAGLSEAEAARRLAEEGPNELPSARPRSVFAIAFGVAQEPMFLLLIAGGIIYTILGDVAEALMLMGFVFVVIGITFFQERRTERTLEALRDLSSPRALVVRDSTERRVAGREVVRGDVVLLREGDRVPADGVALSATHLSVDESLLTGESAPVRKSPGTGAETMAAPGGDDLPFVYSGTLVVQGSGVERVLATGIATEFGRIGESLQRIPPERTRLHRATARLVRTLALVGLSLSVLVVVVYGLTRRSWIEGLLAGITLAMAILPEEFPVVLMVFLALGAWRISRNQVLTRRLPSVETLGSATVLCVDKTGTLTLNAMSVRRLVAAGQSLEATPSTASVPEPFREVVEFSVLASQPDPFDPMEKAIHELGGRLQIGEREAHRDWELVREYPLTKALLSVTRVWRRPAEEGSVIAAKGAPEAIVSLCHLEEARAGQVSADVAAMADDGLRVLGVAKGRLADAALPDRQTDLELEFVGLIGLADPVRPGVRDAVKECYGAGIRIVMITGDHPGTAAAVARQVGLARQGAPITGPELAGMNDADLQQRVRSATIFARIVPEQKLRLVNAFRANGEVVAMTGDGVNDAPALKAASIGVAMGGRGTDVAREASDLVLLDDNFTSIVAAARLGRRIFDNIRKAMAYILAIHVPIAGMSLAPVLLEWPPVLMPVHILFLEVIIDPACSIVFEAEPEGADVMRRPPRSPQQPLFGANTIALSLLQGVTVFLIVLALYAFALHRGLSAAEARALTFTTLVIANVGLIFTNLSWSQSMLVAMRRPNPALWWVAGGAMAFLALVLSIPAFRAVFRFAPLHSVDLAISVGAAAVSVVWFEVLKAVTRLLRRREDDAEGEADRPRLP
jgi:Ca2+-transporting ATPase